MATGIYVFGHGGGVPMGHFGNTNFAIIPNLDVDSIPKVTSYPSEDRTFTVFPANNYTLLESHKFWLIDCGPETMLQICGCMPGYESVVHNLKGICITHAHADHCGGLASLAWRVKFIEQFKPVLVAPPDVWNMLAEQLDELRYHNPASTAANHGTFRLQDYFDCAYYHGTKDEDFEVLANVVDHNIVMDLNGTKFPSYGYIVRVGKSVVVFSGDTAVTHSGWWKDADIMFHDCQFYSDGKDGKHVHCPYSALAALPEELRNKTYLAHTSQEPPQEAYDAGFRWAMRGKLVIVL